MLNNDELSASSSVSPHKIIRPLWTWTARIKAAKRKIIALGFAISGILIGFPTYQFATSPMIMAPPMLSPSFNSEVQSRYGKSIQKCATDAECERLNPGLYALATSMAQQRTSDEIKRHLIVIATGAVGTLIAPFLLYGLVRIVDMLLYAVFGSARGAWENRNAIRDQTAKATKWVADGFKDDQRN